MLPPVPTNSMIRFDSDRICSDNIYRYGRSGQISTLIDSFLEFPRSSLFGARLFGLLDFFGLVARKMGITQSNRMLATRYEEELTISLVVKKSEKNPPILW